MSTIQDSVPASAEGTDSSGNRLWAIFLVSVLGLFLEMMLIRWVGTEVRIFAYLQNTILVVCFLGLGMGCFTCRQPVSARQMLLPLLTLVALLALPVSRRAVSKIGEWMSVGSDMVIWSQEAASSPYEAAFKVTFGLLLAFVLMVLLWEIFVPLGRILGRLMDDHPRTHHPRLLGQRGRQPGRHSAVRPGKRAVLPARGVGRHLRPVVAAVLHQRAAAPG